MHVAACRSHSIQLSLRMEDAGFWQASECVQFRGPQLFLVQPHGDVDTGMPSAPQPGALARPGLF